MVLVKVNDLDIKMQSSYFLRNNCYAVHMGVCSGVGPTQDVDSGNACIESSVFKDWLSSDLRGQVWNEGDTGNQ